MEPNTLQTPNVSGIEKVSSGKGITKSSAKGQLSKKDLLFLNLLGLKQKQAAANGTKLGKTKAPSLVKGKNEEKSNTSAELLAASLLAKGQTPAFLQSKETSLKQDVPLNAINTVKAAQTAKANSIQTNSLLAMKSKANLNPKNEVDIDNKIIAQKLAELSEVEAGDTGLKIKQGMADKQIATTNQIAKNSPQTKGRVKIRGEEKFLNTSIDENSTLKTFSATDIKETDQKLSQVGLTGYGLKKISENIDSNEVEKEGITTSHVDVGKMNAEVKANTSDFSVTADKTHVATNFDSIMEQVDNGLKTSYNHQLKEMKIKLQPEELGEIEVKFRIENNMMKAEFIVESEIVKEALESRFNQLKDNLLERGINTTEVNVYVSSENGDKQNNSGYEREKLLAGKLARVGNSKLNQETLDTNLEAVTRKINTAGESGVNILV